MSSGLRWKPCLWYIGLQVKYKGLGSAASLRFKLQGRKFLHNFSRVVFAEKILTLSSGQTRSLLHGLIQHTVRQRAGGSLQKWVHIELFPRSAVKQAPIHFMLSPDQDAASYSGSCCSSSSTEEAAKWTDPIWSHTSNQHIKKAQEQLLPTYYSLIPAQTICFPVVGKHPAEGPSNQRSQRRRDAVPPAPAHS